MKKVVLFVMAIMLFLSGCSQKEASVNQDNPKGQEFISKMLSVIEDAKPNEFSTPEKTINTFYDSINNNDFDLALKILPIKEDYESTDISLYLQRMGMYKISADAPVPDNDMNNFLTRFASYYGFWQKRYTMRLLASNPGLLDTDIKLENPDSKSKIEIVKNMKATKKFEKPVITGDYDAELNESDKAMEATKKKVIEITTKLDNEEVMETITLLYINDNWKILFI